MINEKLTVDMLKTKDQYLEEFKDVKEPDWWKLGKFPVLLLMFYLADHFFLEVSSIRPVFIAFAIFVYIEMLLSSSRESKKLNILFKIAALTDGKLHLK